MKSDLIRKTWPKIRVVEIKGQSFYRVDARRTGTDGKQETFKVKKEAEKRAAEIEGNFASHGKKGLAFPAELQGMALMADGLLRPYGKTLLQAAEFYQNHLENEKKSKASAKVAGLAGKWYLDKKSGKTKKLRAATLNGIKEASDTLQKLFPTQTLHAVTAGEIKSYLDGLNVGLRRKFNIHSRLSQFFNWCISQGQMTKNPCDDFRIYVEGKDVAIFTPSEALKLMKLCQQKHPTLVLYHAISLFAGLRPTECQLLKWEHVHLKEKTITVLSGTSKTKETRNVPIEPNLLSWLEETAVDARIGFVTNQVNFSNRIKTLRVDMGYKGAGKNQEALEWPQDVMRHSYGSYWLAKFKNRAELAEHMGNSLQIIKKHYKRVVGKTDCAQFWRITPTFDGRGEEHQQPSLEELKKMRAKRVAAATG